MTARFKRIIPFIFKWECVRDRDGNVISENDPDDPGGLTKFGIDQRSHPKVDIRNLSEEDAMEIYHAQYWIKNACDSYPAKLGECYFNACVNCGAGRAKKFLDESGGNWRAFLSEQDDFYRRLAAARPPLKKYLKGWRNRTSDLRKWLGKMEGDVSLMR